MKHQKKLLAQPSESQVQTLEAQHTHEELKAYAEEMGGTEADIDLVLQASNWDGFSKENWDVLD